MARNLITVAAVVGGLVLPAAAHADSRFVIRGAGFGHGVGMSQYGALGFAQQGATYREILAHYYSDTALGRLPAGQTVRVLLRSSGAPQRFAGATRAGGRRVDPSRSYVVRPGPGGTVELASAKGRRLVRVAPPLRVTGGGDPVQLMGPALNGRSDGTYRGALEFRPNGFGINAINAVSLEDYVRGVVPLESPSSWPAEALKAQAVAARTYAMTTSKAGPGFEHYPDQRSQVYGGVSAEQATTNAATTATAGEVVTYDGRPVVTYFFSTSGGRTEDVENVFGGAAQPWLRSVKDPYDKTSPRHRWGPIRLSLRRAGRKLGNLVEGRFRGIEVVRRGRSPRVIAADVIGTRGRTRTTGAVLRARLGLFDTWAYFTTVSARRRGAPKPSDETTQDEQPQRQAAGDRTTGGSSPQGRTARAAHSARATVAGRVIPARRGALVVIQRRSGRRWIDVGSATVRKRGWYAEPVFERGTYRPVYGRVAGPRVRIR